MEKFNFSKEVTEEGEIVLKINGVECDCYLSKKLTGATNNQEEKDGNGIFYHIMPQGDKVRCMFFFGEFEKAFWFSPFSKKDALEKISNEILTRMEAVKGWVESCKKTAESIVVFYDNEDNEGVEMFYKNKDEFSNITI